MSRKIGKDESRTKDAVDALKKRISNFKEQTAPVIEMYNRFGKVSFISGEGEVNEVYAETRKAIFPQVSFLVGPQGSGKTVLGQKLCERTNMRLINFSSFIVEENL